MEKVSVVIPLYNKAPYIERALRSVLTQTFGDFEVIVVDDGSTDGGGKIVESISDNRIKLFRQENAGVSAARNAGIKAAKGEWIAFLDADDEWVPEKLELQMRAISSHPDAAWVAGGYRYIRVSAGGMEVPQKDFLDEWFEDDCLITDAFLPLTAGHFFWVVTAMVRRDVLLEFGGFDRSLRIGEELNLWLKLALKYPKILYIQKPLAKYYGGLDGALMTIAYQQYDISYCANSARRVISLIGQVDGSHAKLLAQLARRNILMGVKYALAIGRKDFAKQLLRDFDWFDLGYSGKMMKVLACAPKNLLLLVCKTIRFIKKYKFRLLI
jgi:glycosyltransferase involved in cell wall biosynthesis